MSACSIADVPHEILEHIFHFLRNDVAALGASALVQRSWIAMTRRHIFGHFGEAVICRRLRHRRRISRRKLHDNATEFIEICRSHLCTILNFIRSVIVLIDEPSLDEAIINILTTAPNLRKVVYFDMQEEQDPARWLSGKLPQLEEFVYGAHRHFGEDTVNMISTFVGVRTLAMYGYGFDSTHPKYPTNSGAFRDAFTNLRHLRIDLREHETLFQWLLGSCPSIHLESLQLCMFSPYHRGWGPVRYLNGFLASQGGTLNYLSLTCNYAGYLQAQSPSDSDEGTIVNLAPLSYLSKLAFKTHDLKTVQASLVTLSSDSMQELHVEHMPWVGDTYFRCTCEELQELRNLRNTAARRSLSQVAFQFCPGSGTDEQAAFDIFKEQIESGRLEFVDGSTTQPWFQPDTFPALYSRILGRTPTVPYSASPRSGGRGRGVKEISEAAAKLSV